MFYYKLPLFIVLNLTFINFSAERFKQKIQFILLERNFVDILDACKIADYILFVVSAEIEVDQFGELCLRAIQSQGSPTIITTAMVGSICLSRFIILTKKFN